MKVINEYIVKYKSSLCMLYEVEDGRFFVKFTAFGLQGWKEQTKEISTDEAAELIIV